MATGGLYQAGAHVFVDESKARGYYVAASIVASEDVAVTRKEVSALCRPGQRRVHFKSESDRTRDAFLAAVVAMPVTAVVYMSQGPDRVARPQCLTALARDVSASSAKRLVLERDDSVEAADRRIIARELNGAAGAELEYVHCRAHEEPILWVSDAVAWCFQKGGPWRRRVEPIVRDVRRVGP